MIKEQCYRHRLRYFGHIVNLYTQAFLVGKDVEKACIQIERHTQDGDWKSLADLWRKWGVIGRLHNIIRYIRATSQYRNEFRKIRMGGDLAQFNGLEVSTNFIVFVSY